MNRQQLQEHVDAVLLAPMLSHRRQLSYIMTAIDLYALDIEEAASRPDDKETDTP